MRLSILAVFLNNAGSAGAGPQATLPTAQGRRAGCPHGPRFSFAVRQKINCLCESKGSSLELLRHSMLQTRAPPGLSQDFKQAIK